MTISFSGITSGIDTASIIAGLVSVESNKRTLLKKQQANYADTVSAYTALTTKLTSLKSAASALADTTSWSGTTATSTSDNVKATATGSTTASLTFDVTQLAKAHALISSGSVGSTATNIASSGSVSITNSATGVATAVSVGTGSLSEVVSAINSSDAGVTASAVQTSSGVYRLQLQSSTTGEAGQFTVSGIDGFTSMQTLTTGQDAELTVGSGAAQFTATSKTNTFDDLVSGLSFTVSAVETGVTVASSVSATDASSKVQSVVDAANSVLSYITQQTAFDSTQQAGGALMGEAAARTVQNQVLSLFGAAGVDGISVETDGTVSFDSAAFATSFKKNPTAVTQALAGSLTGTINAAATGTSVALNSATATAKPGSYAVVLTQAPTQDAWTAATAGVSAGKTFAITSGSTSISYTASATDGLADTISQLNKKFSAASVGITASLNADGTSIDFKASEYGSAHNFTVKVDGTTQTETQAGQDVAGTIAGEAAMGVGQYLSLTSGSSGAVGLSMKVTSTPADVTATGGAIGTVTYRTGFGLSLSQMVAAVTDTTTGEVATASASAQKTVTDYDAQITAWTDRIQAYQDRLTLQFTNMETMINSLKTQQSALTSLLSSS